MHGTLGRWVVATSVVLLGGCRSEPSTDPSDGTSASASPAGAADAASPSPDADLIEGSFDVGDHELYMRCSGTGSPTVVYLHGSIPDPAFPGHSSALAIQDMLDEDYRMCVYDRANIGLSDSVEGPLDGESSVADLHGLLDTAGIEPPYVLLAASFGGLIADIYAATYPDEVVGMVQLDANVPGTLEEIVERFVPEEDRPQADDWIGTNEEIDELAVFAQAGELEGDLPAIPLTYLAIRESIPDPKEMAALRELQRGFVERFSPGRFVILDVPHYMEPEIPERITREIERVIAATGAA